MFGRSCRSIGLLVCFFWPLLIAPAWSMEKPKESTAPKIEPQAAQVLKRMTDYLKGLQQFSVRMMTRKKLMSKARMVFLFVVVLGGLVLVNADKSPLSPGGEAWATSLGARRGVGTSAGVGGGAVGPGPGAPARGAAGTPVAAPRGYVR